jgi:hypothetical protein
LRDPTHSFGPLHSGNESNPAVRLTDHVRSPWVVVVGLTLKPGPGCARLLAWRRRHHARSASLPYARSASGHCCRLDPSCGASLLPPWFQMDPSEHTQRRLCIPRFSCQHRPVGPSGPAGSQSDCVFPVPARGRFLSPTRASARLAKRVVRLARQMQMPYWQYVLCNWYVLHMLFYL